MLQKKEYKCVNWQVKDNNKLVHVEVFLLSTEDNIFNKIPRFKFFNRLKAFVHHIDGDIQLTVRFYHVLNIGITNIMDISLNGLQQGPGQVFLSYSNWLP